MKKYLVCILVVYMDIIFGSILKQQEKGKK